MAVHWNAHGVPFLAARHDADLAVALGLVHVHLRWAQMEIMRRVALGRMAEMLGPPGIRLDHGLRTLGLARAVPDTVASLPAGTRAWLDGFVAGINHAVRHLKRAPPEFRLLGLRREAWSVADVLALTRLAGADVTWFRWFALLRRGPSGLSGLLRRFTRAASNAFAVAPGRSATGAAWLAGDAHLPGLLPSLFLVAGMEAPSLNAVGLMVPGIPAPLIGRNARIAWGGTNLHAASSDLFDAADLQAATRTERLRVRLWPTRRVAVRDTALGPLISDLPALSGTGRPVALRWVGHQPSDEVGALLAIARAGDWEAFREAAEGVAVPGQNLVFADAAGHVGKCMAARLPRRPPVMPPAPFPPALAAHWDRMATGRDLPARLDPPEGFVVSANEAPADPPVLVGYGFSDPARARRMAALLAGNDRVDRAAVDAILHDVTLDGALAARDRMLPGLPPGPLRAALAGWDGRYAADSAGALAFELLQLGDAAAAGAGLRHFGSWGGLHRMAPRHVLAGLPGIGRKYRIPDWPADGTSNTLLRSAHARTGRRHRARLVSTARYVFDLSDPDANDFVLLGGQDGWPRAPCWADQIPLWRAGRTIRVPLRAATAAAAFPFHLILAL